MHDYVLAKHLNKAWVFTTSLCMGREKENIVDPGNYMDNKHRIRAEHRMRQTHVSHVKRVK